MSLQRGLCRSCGAEILWAQTERNKAMPLDAEPSSLGNVVLVKLVDGREVAKYVSPTTAEVYHSLPHYHSHFSTCPDAGQWRHK